MLLTEDLCRHRHAREGQLIIIEVERPNPPPWECEWVSFVQPNAKPARNLLETVARTTAHSIDHCVSSRRSNGEHNPEVNRKGRTVSSSEALHSPKLTASHLCTLGVLGWCGGPCLQDSSQRNHNARFKSRLTTMYWPGFSPYRFLTAVAFEVIEILFR